MEGKLKIIIVLVMIMGFTSLFSEESLFYYEANNKVIVKREKNLFIQFGKTSTSAIKRNPRNQILRQTPRYTLWRIQEGVGSRTTETDRISEVYRDSYNRRIAFPGNIIITFGVEMKRKDVEAWAKKNQVRIIYKFPLETQNMYLIHSPSGKRALEQSNILRQKKEVLSAIPEIWREVFPR